MYIFPRYHIVGFEVDFTERQWKIVIGMSYGLDNKEIARKLNLSVFTLKNRIKVIFDALGMCSRLDVALWFLDRREKYIQLRGEHNGFKTRIRSWS